MLPIKRLEIKPIKSGENLFSCTLPVTEKNVTFKYMTGRDEKDQQALVNNKKRIGIYTESEITDYLFSVVQSIGEVTNREHIKLFIDNMPARDAKFLRNYISDNRPGLDLNHKYSCQKCGQLSRISLPFNADFFWPNS